jgi:N-acetyl-gamma-glutamyl-phosphate reductase
MTESNKCRVKIVGATGYTGGELIRILLNHPNAEIASLTAAGFDDPQPIQNFWVQWRDVVKVPVTPETPGEGQDCDIIFLSVPHGIAMKLAPAYLDKGFKVIDLSADYRFKDLSEREGWYTDEHTSPELCETAVYGMPELFRDEVKGAQLIANPGCYPTTAILGLYPGLKEGLLAPERIRVNSTSGVTGAGRNPKLPFMHPEFDQNYFAYRIGNHQHAPEIVSILRRTTNKPVSCTFVPHVMPIQRGILSTIYCQKSGDHSLESIWEVYNTIYGDETFIRLYALGEAPVLQAVQMSNFVDISIHEDKITGDIVIISAEDNLTKGAAGQAVQNMNIMMGYPESSGLLPQ